MNADTPLRKVLNALGGDARPSGDGWMCRCPAHEDARASLSVNEVEDGKVLVKCFAGCTAEQVVNALGLAMSDLFPATTGPERPALRTVKPAKKTDNSKTGGVFPTADAAVSHLEQRQGKVAGRWEYHNPNGELVGLVLRFDRADGSKFFQPVAKFPDGWRVKAMTAPRPVYHLPAVAGADTVFVVEGEKCAVALGSLGYTAATSAGGANAAKHTDWSPLAGKKVIILPDNDEPGRKYAADVVKLFGALNPAPDVRVLNLPGLPDGGDIADWLEDCRGKPADTVKAEFDALVAAAPVPVPMPISDPAAIVEVLTNAEMRRSEPRRSASVAPKVVCLGDVEPEEVRWLWRDRIAVGKLTLLVGRPKEGKSFLTVFMAATISTGAVWLDGEPAPVGDTLFISAEDDPADTIRPRLDAAGANCRRVHLLTAVEVTSENGEKKEVAFTLQNVELIRQALDGLPDCKLVVIDPIGSYLGGGVDAHRDNEVRAVLAPLAALAAERDVAVLIVCHNRKADTAHADDSTLGSRGFVGIARSVLHLRTDPDDPEKRRRVFAAGGINNAATAAALAFRITGQPPRLDWEPEPLAGFHADDLMKPPTDRPRGPQAEKREAAEEWLVELLKDGPLPVGGEGGIREQAEAAELSWRTIRRAQERLGITPRKQGYSGTWVWGLPAEGGHADSPKVAKRGETWPPSGKSGGNPVPEPENAEGGQVVPHLATFGEAVNDDLATFGENVASTDTPDTLVVSGTRQPDAAYPEEAHDTREFGSGVHPAVRGKAETPSSGGDPLTDRTAFEALLRRAGWGWPEAMKWLDSLGEYAPLGGGFADLTYRQREMLVTKLTEITAATGTAR